MIYEVRVAKPDITRRIVSKIVPVRLGLVQLGLAKVGQIKLGLLKFAFLLLFLGVGGTALSQSPSSEPSAPFPQLQPKGKNVFEMKCATCHGLDGLGGEHAPDIIRPTAVSSLSDQALLSLIHDGIPQSGMPAFSDLNPDDGHALVAYLRFLQGTSRNAFQTNSTLNSAAFSVPADPIRGRELFFGKAGCSPCHQIAGQGQFIADNVTEFAKDHQPAEIRTAILRPAGGQRNSATAIAKDGRNFSGTIRNEDNASLQLQDGDGRFYLLMKSSLASVQRKTADPMPADYGQRLTATEIADLIAYIRREAGAADIPSSPSEKNKAKRIDNDEEPHVQD